MGGLLRAGRERRTPSVKNTVGYVTTVIAALRDPDVDRLGPVRSAVGERIETQDWDAIARGVTLVYYDPSPSSSPDQPAPTPAYLARPITIARPGLNRADGVSISVLTYTGGACDFTALIAVVRETPSRAAIRALGIPCAASLLINAQSSKVITLRSSVHFTGRTVQLSSGVDTKSTRNRERLTVACGTLSRRHAIITPKLGGAAVTKRLACRDEILRLR